jgi:transposase InsO family protein
MRALRRRGCVVAQPKKRPKSSFVRFEASLPNECWQPDMTHWALADGTGVEIVNILDDHSRLCAAPVALPVTKAVEVVTIFQAAGGTYGTPASMLTDNGCIYTAKHRGWKAALETELERLGVTFKHPRPYHPRTCAKIERFHGRAAGLVDTSCVGLVPTERMSPRPRDSDRSSSVTWSRWRVGVI